MDKSPADAVEESRLRPHHWAGVAAGRNRASDATSGSIADLGIQIWAGSKFPHGKSIEMIRRKGH
jgi:hypothetical protein